MDCNVSRWLLAMTIKFNIPESEHNVAVAVSGGGDSMALGHMMCEWAVENDTRIHLLTVNHNLRDEAEKEAQQVAQFIAQFPNATHKILKWEMDEKPHSAVMEQARNARYELMAQYCETHAIETLCVAHHGDDNLETFLFRLAKGSGLGGLTGMKQWSNYNDTLKIYRPLLECSHDDLIAYCLNNRIDWIEDPSNRDEKYARPRLRNALAQEGFETHRFVKTLSRLSRAQDALDWMVEKAQNECVHHHRIDYYKLKTYPLDIQIRVLQKIISDIGEVSHSYPPKLDRVEAIVTTLKPSQSATLHGCVLTCSKDGNTLEITGA